MRPVVAFMFVLSFAQAASIPGRTTDQPFPSSYTFAIVVETEQPIPPTVLSEMQRELSRIYRDTGYHLEWHKQSTLGLNQSFPDLGVFRIKGDCGFNRELQSADRRRPLGSTLVWKHKILPFSTLDCDRVRTAIEPSVHFTTTTNNAKFILLGRALGRVAAHELYHILARTTAHGRYGVTKESLSAEELLQPALDLDRRATNLLKKSSQLPYLMTD